MTPAERLLQTGSFDELRSEIARLTAENERLREAFKELEGYAESELTAWDSRNADRYWQMRRVVGKLRLVYEAALRGAEP